jgi:hypothetical protein
MSPGEYQQQKKDELRERFINGPDVTRMRAVLSATELQRNELSKQLTLSRHRVSQLERDLDRAHEKLAEARHLLAELIPATYWDKVSTLVA